MLAFSRTTCVSFTPMSVPRNVDGTEESNLFTKHIFKLFRVVGHELASHLDYFFHNLSTVTGFLMIRFIFFVILLQGKSPYTATSVLSFNSFDQSRVASDIHRPWSSARRASACSAIACSTRHSSSR